MNIINGIAVECRILKETCLKSKSLLTGFLKLVLLPARNPLYLFPSKIDKTLQCQRNCSLKVPKMIKSEVVE